MSECGLGEDQIGMTMFGGDASLLPDREPCRLPLPGEAPHPVSPFRNASTMSQPCCMIVEDQALIGMSLEASLEEAGFTVAGPFMSCAQALQWLEHNSPDLAVLDVIIKDGTSLQIAG